MHCLEAIWVGRVVGFSLRRWCSFFGTAFFFSYCIRQRSIFWRTLGSHPDHEANDDGYTPFSCGDLLMTKRLTLLDIHEPPASNTTCIIPMDSS